jgi:hypothetical protein
MTTDDSIEEWDLDLANYSISDLITLFDLSDPLTAETINIKASELLSMADNENNEDLSFFIGDAKDTLLDYLKTQESTNNDKNYMPDYNDDGGQLEEWTQNQYLTQDNENQRDMITDRYNQVQVDNTGGHFTMKKNSLAVGEGYDVPVAQGTINPNLKNTNHRIINIDSQFRQNISYDPSNCLFACGNQSQTSSTNYTFSLTNTLKNVISFSLYSLELPTTWYVFDHAYGTNAIDISGTTYYIPSGNYDISGLIDQLNILDPDLSFGYNPINYKIDISSNPSDSITITFFDPTYNTEGLECAKENNSLGWLLGFKQSSYTFPASSKFTAEGVYDIGGPKYLLLAVDDFNKNHLNKGIIGVGNIETKLAIPNYVNFDLGIIPDASGDCTYTNFRVAPSAPRRITNAKLYTINSIMENRQNLTRVRYFSPNSMDIFAKIPLMGATLGTPFITNDQGLQINDRIYFGPVDIVRLKVQLLNDKGQILNLNGADWSFSLQVDILYQY